MNGDVWGCVTGVTRGSRQECKTRKRSMKEGLVQWERRTEGWKWGTGDYWEVLGRRSNVHTGCWLAALGTWRRRL